MGTMDSFTNPMGALLFTATLLTFANVPRPVVTTPFVVDLSERFTDLSELAEPSSGSGCSSL